MNLINKVIEDKNTSLIMPFVGILAQCISWLILFPIGVAVHKNKFGSAVIAVLTAVWFFVPIISLLGIYSGINYLQKNNYSLSPAIGIVLNTIWFILFLCFCYVVFYLGISV